MKKRIRAFCVASLSLSSLASVNTLSAFDRYDPCCENECGGLPAIYAEAEYLFVKPCVDDLDWAVKSSQNIAGDFNVTGEGSVKHLDPGWKSGFRLKVGKDDIIEDWGVSLGYSYLKGEESAKETRPEGGTLLPTMIHLGNLGASAFNADEARAKWSLRIQTIDILINHPMQCNECHLFNPYFGAEALILNQMIKSEFLAGQEDLSSRWESDYWGVGVVLGMRYDWKLTSCFGFFADVSGRIIRGDADMDDHFRTNVLDALDQDFKFRYNDCLFVPGYKIAVGFSFNQELCGKKFRLDAGYEFMRWHHLPNPRRYVTGSEGLPISTSPSTSALGLHGALIGLQVNF
ncbi:Lpg1974 family pore-forming outer membrane protein [Estrella lausannensis]|uniref:Outer membrane protein n=1 Tax=Estrella lausannensis TaxID=483423 RepID=A0A0H5DSB3_9BACT|nr:Lpg1974 family pore-forming outer membrane protein [Estrella lausannensis]CRX38639.1 Outer membrane protein [Estrella lausannensis]